MGRVKMNAKHEYEYLANYKILQNVFKAHKIDRVSEHILRKFLYLNSASLASTSREAGQMQNAVRSSTCGASGQATC
jgi:hypothetical protein